MPIFRVKSVKIYTRQKNLHRYTRGARDKYQVWLTYISNVFETIPFFKNSVFQEGQKGTT